MTIARRTPLRRTTAIDRGAPLARSSRKPTPPPERVWTDAIAKRDREGRCRVCGAKPGPAVVVQAAHTIGREHDRPKPHPQVIGAAGPLWVDPDDTVPLCVQADGGCHGGFDGRRLDLLPHLTKAEQAAAVRHVGIVAAHRRLTGGRA